MIVTDLDQIHPHTCGLLDLEIEAFYTQLKESHPDIDNIAPRRINEDSQGVSCSACGAPVITTWSINRDTTRPGCKNCVVALKMRGYGKFMGFRYPELRPGCTGCRACLLVCPDFVFEVYQFETPVEHEVPA